MVNFHVTVVEQVEEKNYGTDNSSEGRTSEVGRSWGGGWGGGWGVEFQQEGDEKLAEVCWTRGTNRREKGNERSMRRQHGW